MITGNFFRSGPGRVCLATLVAAAPLITSCGEQLSQYLQPTPSAPAAAVNPYEDWWGWVIGKVGITYVIEAQDGHIGTIAEDQVSIDLRLGMTVTYAVGNSVDSPFDLYELNGLEALTSDAERPAQVSDAGIASGGGYGKVSNVRQFNHPELGLVCAIDALLQGYDLGFGSPIFDIHQIYLSQDYLDGYLPGMSFEEKVEFIDSLVGQRIVLYGPTGSLTDGPHTFIDPLSIALFGPGSPDAEGFFESGYGLTLYGFSGSK